MNIRAFQLRPLAEFFRNWSPSRLGWGALASIPGLAVAGPTGESVVAGGAVVTRPSATHTQIDQSTSNAIVNWSTFSVNGDEYVIFNQPGTTASILNRVIGSEQSNILGQIQANGRVFLVNPQGVYFAPGAKVDVGALTATVLDITNEDFMAGHYVFRRPESAPDGASVTNEGEISVSDGGYVVLAGDYAENTGVVSARLGQVVLAAGNQMTMDLSDDGLVSFAIDEATVASLAGVKNSGDIIADGGRIVMTAKVASDLVATAVNNEGLLQANRIVEDGGEIFLTASGGNIEHTGTIDVSGTDNRDGGTVTILSDEDIVLDNGSKVHADGAGTGNGGTVTVIADGDLEFRKDADMTVTAGASGERGGTVELSGLETLSAKGNLEIGSGGQLLLDPAVLTLDSGSLSYGSMIGVNWVETQLSGGVDVTLSASSSITKTGGVTDITAGGFGDLRFLISDTAGDINLSGLEINIGGNFSATAGAATGDVNLGQITNARNVNISAGVAPGDDITLDTGGIAAASSAINLTAGGDITVAGDITLFSPADNVNININAGENVVVSGDISAAGFSGGRVDIVGMNISVGDVDTFAASGDAEIRVTATGNVSLGDVTAEVSPSYGGTGYGGGFFGSASIDIVAGNNITVDDVTAIAPSDSAFIQMDATNNLTVNGQTLLVAFDEASISYSASNMLAVNGDILGVNIGSDSYVSIELRGDNGVTVNGDIKGVISGTTGSVDIRIDANNGDITVNGDIEALALGNDADVRVSADFATGDITINGDVDVVGTSASFRMFGNDVVVNGAVNVEGTSFANLRTRASGNLTMAGPVNITEDSGGSARAFYEYGNVGLFGAHNIIAGPGGYASFYAGSSEGGDVGNTAVFNGRVNVEGGSFGAIAVDTNNVIRTVGAGILEAEAVGLQVRNTGTTVIDVRTNSPFVQIQNIGLTPDLSLDNRAFGGVSTVSFGSGATVKAASILATGPLFINGPLTADNLAVGVTGGPVTFNSPVFITGASPFLPTAPDIALFQIMAQRGLSPPLHGPNVQIFAQSGININNPFVVGGPSAFTKMFTNGPFNVSGLTTTAPSMLSVFSPIDTTRAIFFEDEPFSQPSGASAFFNFPTINGLPNTDGTTIVLGEMGPGGVPVLNGDVTIGSNGSIDIGNRNMFIISRGSVSGDDLVSTTGIFEIIGIAASEFFQVPIVSEFNEETNSEDEEDEDESLALGDEDSDDDGGEVSEESNSESMECPA